MWKKWKSLIKLRTAEKWWNKYYFDTIVFDCCHCWDTVDFEMQKVVVVLDKKQISRVFCSHFCYAEYVKKRSV